MELLEELKDSWNSQEILMGIALKVCSRQEELAEMIASEEQNFNNTFITEREEAFKGTDSMARARAKSLVGTNQTKYEYEFQILSQLFTLINVRISQLSPRLQQSPRE